MKKEICIIISKLSVGGAQRRAVTLANEFAKSGYSVYILALSSDDSSDEAKKYYVTEKNVDILTVSDSYQKHANDKNTKHIMRTTAFYLFFLKSFQALLNFLGVKSDNVNFLIKALRKSIAIKSFFVYHKKATIISFEFEIFERVYFSTKGFNNKIIYAETNSSKRYESNPFFKQIKKCIKNADAWVFQTKEERAEHGMQNTTNAFVINNPINPDLPSAYTGKRKPIIVNFCRMSRQKNLLLLIKAFEKLIADFPDYKLEIYADSSGSNNTGYKEELLDYISKHNLEKHIEILPPTAEIHDKILDYAMFVSSSDFEGISNSMIEAMAIGLPCVCTDCNGGGAREMISDGENGLLVPIGDAESLKNAMARMISEEGLAEKCSNNASKIRETHSVEKIASKWIEVIEQV